MAAVTAISPGTLASVPVISNFSRPRSSESPTSAFSATRSDASTTTWRPFCSAPHADAGSVSIWP